MAMAARLVALNGAMLHSEQRLPPPNWTRAGGAGKLQQLPALQYRLGGEVRLDLRMSPLRLPPIRAQEPSDSAYWGGISSCLR